MDADEKLLELKKAYADVILNISKEAATKVMASERRAMRYQQEMKIAKDESLRLLMRIKQMMDSKISEAEAASLNQQSKIAELEAQLQEAEDIVSGLREELAQVQSELESVKYHNLHRENKRPLDDTENPYQYIKILPSLLPHRSTVASGAKTSYLHQRQECHKCRNKLDCTCSLHVENQDLPSIISRGNKDSSFYRNGRTQRIRACERNVLDREICPGKVKNEDNGKEPAEEKDMSKTPSSGTKTSSEMDKTLLENANFSTSQSFLRKRKRATRQKKPVRALNSHIKTDQFPVSVKDGASFTENLSSETQTLSSDKDGPLQILTKASETEENRVENLDAGKMGELNVNLVPSEDKTGFAESLCSPVELDDDKRDVPSHNLEDPSDLTETLPSQSVRERVIKYTFQRKRKKPAFAGSEAKHSLETETKVRDKQDGDKKLEQSKHISVMESSRECRRMAQVARQLLSLSDRKWWD